MMHKGFMTTQWAVVRRAAENDETYRLEAMEQLLCRYCPALKEFVLRRFGLREEECDDLIQSFVLDKVLKRNLLAQASQERGKFRTFLLRSLQNYLRDKLKWQHTQARRPEHGWLSLSELSPDDLNQINAESRDLFDDSFARQVIAETLHRCHTHCVSHGLEDVWEIFHARILGPMLEDVPPEPYEQLQAALGLSSVEEAHNKLGSAKRIFRKQFQ
ncbi:MAG: hypothetical protein AB1813_19785, partial [Verrucomicrobiota bacterium]